MHDLSWIEVRNIRGLDSPTLQKIAYTLDIYKFKNKVRLELAKEIVTLQDDKNKFLYYDDTSELFRKNEYLNVWKYYEKGEIL
jgi:hypothetical protein